VCRGAAAAAVSEFQMTVRGRGGHGAFPHTAVDSVLCAAQIVTSLQTLVPREISALERSVLTVGTFHAGTAFNIMPERAELGGTIRSANPAVHETLARRAREMAEGIAAAYRCTVEFRHRKLIPPVMNDETMSELVRTVAREVGARDVVVADPVMAGDDVALFLDRAPGCYFFVGAAYTDGRPQTPHHSPEWDIDEDAMVLGANVLLTASERFLGLHAPP
jgi:amidohydrolase